MNQFDKRHLANVRKYQRQIDKIYREAAAQVAARYSGLPVPDDAIFSFDDYPAIQAQIDVLIRQMAGDIELTVQDGVRTEWDLSNDKNDALVDSVFGENAIAARYKHRSVDALDAFMNRKTAGLNLSDRVWNYTNQFKGEIEMGLDCGIREGLDAASMARQLQQYLVHPDMLFRRVRDEHGILRLSQRAAQYHPGQGVYRSSYKNARRLAATETNIAYRTADHDRWQQFDFVVGIRIELSNNHTCLNAKGKPVPFFDICDELQGSYPKEFKFVGWHPHCRCIATAITKTEKEAEDDFRRALRGEEKSDPKDSENYVGEMPDNFKQWMEDNAERIAGHKTQPYFIRDNVALINGTAAPEEPRLTPFEIAEQRHAQRDDLSVMGQWYDRQANNLFDDINAGLLPKEAYNGVQEIKNSIALGDYDDARRRIATYQTAVQRHATRSAEQAQAIRDAWNAEREQKRLIELGANNMIKVAAGYGESDVAALQQAMQLGELNAVRSETRALAQQLLGIRAQEKALADLIPDVHLWHQQFTMAELQAVHGAVQSKLAQWSTLTLEQQAKKLQFEAVDFLGGNMKGVQQKYSTWKVSQSAYLKQLDKVNDKIFWDKLNSEYAQLKQWQALNKSKSKKLADLLDEFQTSIVEGKKLQAQNAIYEAQITKGKLEQAALKRAAKKAQTSVTGTSFDADAYSQARKDKAMWAKRTADADARLRNKCGLVWQGASKAEKDAIYGYTNSYHNIQEPLRGLTYYGSDASKRQGLNRIPHITNMIDRSTYDFDMWVQRGDTRVAFKKFGLANWEYASDAEIKGLVGATGTEGGFWSAGVSKGSGFDSKPVIFNIYMPKGTKAMYCEPFSAFGSGSGRAWDGITAQSYFGGEAEILLQRGTTFRITKVEKAGGTWFVDVEVIAQEPLPFPYVGGFPYK